jgi:hypothetical protein
MSYTFLDQQNKLAGLLGDANTSVDDAFPAAVRRKELNRGELHFARDAKALQEYVTGTIVGSSIAVPDDWIETFTLVVNGVVVSNDYEVSLSDYERYATDSGTPWFYVWRTSGVRYITFFSSSFAGQTYQLWYFKKPATELSADADVSSLDEEYREAPVYYAAGQLLNQIGKVTLATQYMNIYAQYVAQATQDLEKNYIKKEYPRPDLGITNSTSENRVGHGSTF